jgi:hypothetical protein
MDSTVKAAMLKSSRTMAVSRPPSPPMTPQSLRRSRSNDSFDLPRQSLDSPARPPIADIFAPVPRSPSRHFRGSTVDLTRSTTPFPSGQDAKRADKKGTLGRNFAPPAMVTLLANASSVQLDLETVKKLRLLLRNESATWVMTVLHPIA